MSLSQCPILTTVVAHQHQHELRRMATQWHAASRAAPTPLPGAATLRHVGTASQLAVSWCTRVAFRLHIPLPAHLTPEAEAWSQG